jgi:uncharacterized protein YcbK (DUF882 family)
MRLKNSVFFGLLFLATFASAQSLSPKNPFFLVGDGKLKIKNQNNGRFADVTYLNPDGTLNEEAFRKIDAVFGYPTDVMGENISRRTVAFLDYFADQYNPAAIVQLASGYRSQDYNNALRKMGRTAAKTSTHIDGMAIDFSLPGVKGMALWEKMREKNCCGAGYYYGNIVHLDSARPRWWTTETSKVHTNASDFNRYIYFSTEYDRYQPGDATRGFFTSVSDFGFGVKSTFHIVKDEAGLDDVATGKLSSRFAIKDPKDSECLLITERKHARFLDLTFPQKLKAGQYFVRVDFCHKTATEMPDFKTSNPIEIVKR